MYDSHVGHCWPSLAPAKAGTVSFLLFTLPTAASIISYTCSIYRSSKAADSAHYIVYIIHHPSIYSILVLCNITKSRAPLKLLVRFQRQTSRPVGLPAQSPSPRIRRGTIPFPVGILRCIPSWPRQKRRTTTGNSPATIQQLDNKRRKA